MPCKHGSGHGRVSFVVVEVVGDGFPVGYQTLGIWEDSRKSSIGGINGHQIGIRRIRIPEDLPKTQSCLAPCGYARDWQR